MQRVAGNALCDTVLIDLWASRLPPHTQAAVIASKGAAVDKTTIADAIVDSVNLRGINAIINGCSNTSPTADSTDVVATLKSLQKEISQLSKRFDRLAKKRNSTRIRSKSRSRADIQDENCWYHAKFGENARKFKEPCTYSQRPSPTK
ncbi:PREDICTED: uncharacterized protein LOC108374940 [Rhagoletis zephyria]|uniref:uncharacterized protein LOC108374940 n=1 Tax=Rhagoletis zephyria TaxID=28612 RepID=UPI0008114E58|nr:PREDICTED: uncharacterized protein LOC108374940 [Rhagoletis zephyria]